LVSDTTHFGHCFFFLLLSNDLLCMLCLGYLNGTAGATTDGKTRIEPLPAVDHSTIMYAPFKKHFYTQSAELSGLTATEIAERRGMLFLFAQL